MTLWLVGVMGVAAVVCLLVGWGHQGAEWMSLLEAAGLMVLGLAAVATGLLEWEWLERVVNLVIDIWTGWIPWWWGRSSSLSESDTLGRRGATVIWVGIGVALFAWGCWVAL